MRHQERVIAHPKIIHGKPVIKGTGIPAHVVFNLLAGGMGEEKVLKETLTGEDILARLEYAARLAEEEVGVLE